MKIPSYLFIPNGAILRTKHGAIELLDIPGKRSVTKIQLAGKHEQHDFNVTFDCVRPQDQSIYSFVERF